MLAVIRALLILLLLAIPAQAQSVVACFLKKEVLDILQKDYAEYPTWSGATGDGAKYLVTRSHSGSWTLLRLDGEKACIVAAGGESAVARGV